MHLKKKTKHCKGFTLAEVCMVLGIAGVLMALLIPALMNTTQDDLFRIKYKQAYSHASQVWLRLFSQNQIMERARLTHNAANNDHFNRFRLQFLRVRDCTANNNSNCWSNDGETLDGGIPTSDAMAFIDNSGTAWSRMCNDDTCNGFILIDVNAFDGPNRYGTDRFIIVASNNLDVGYENETQTPSKVMPIPNVDPVNNQLCPSGNCEYTSILE